MEKMELVFVPSPGISHLVSALEFAKCLIKKDEGIAVTLLVISSPFHSPSDLASSNPSIKFLTLPQVNPPDLSSKTSPEKAYSLFIEQQKTHVKEAITNHVLSDSTTCFGGLVFDFLCSSMIDVANELGVPSYMFLPCGTSLLSLMLYLPDHYNTQKGSEFTESDPDSIITGFSNPVPTSVLPSLCFSTEGGYESFLNHGIRMKQTKGIFVNSFLELEKHAFTSLGLTPHVPPIYTVGPIIGLASQKKPDSNKEKIIQWLDNQPSESVVFLCFGSCGCFGETQLSHIATALERSGHRFLWSIRKRLTSQTFRSPGDYADFSEALPEGFLERTKDRGLVCGWSPQIEILAHEAIGCFVSHCGWNSVLESVWFGKPIVTWPLYAEQQLNAYQLVKELGLAVELTLVYRYEKGDQEIVTAEEIEKAVKNAMDPENPLRKRVKEMSEIGRKAMEEGGSSSSSISRFVDDFLGKKPMIYP